MTILRSINKFWLLKYGTKNIPILFLCLIDFYKDDNTDALGAHGNRTVSGYQKARLSQLFYIVTKQSYPILF